MLKVCLNYLQILLLFFKKDYNYFPNKECQVPFIPKEIKKYNQSLYLLLNSSCKLFYSDTSKHSPVYLEHFIKGKLVILNRMCHSEPQEKL